MVAVAREREHGVVRYLFGHSYYSPVSALVYCVRFPPCDHQLTALSICWLCGIVNFLRDLMTVVRFPYLIHCGYLPSLRNTQFESPMKIKTEQYNDTLIICGRIPWFIVVATGVAQVFINIGIQAS